MPMEPLSQAIATDCLRKIRLVATDMDGTLTLGGKFTPDLLAAFRTLATSGVDVLIVTGRSAGWVNGLAHYLPVRGAIAENGGLCYWGHQEDPEFLTPLVEPLVHRAKLAQCFQQLQQRFPDLRESGDNRFRLTDWTFDVQGLSPEDLAQLAEQCAASGWGFTYSTVQCHIKPLAQEKSAGLQDVLRRQFPGLRPEEVVTVGDSPNDESLFDTSLFPLSVGVANLRHYADRLAHRPAYLTAAAEGDGFAELVAAIAAARG